MQELSVVKLHHKTTHTQYINSGYNMFYRIIMMVWLSNLNSVALYSIGDFVQAQEIMKLRTRQQIILLKQTKTHLSCLNSRY